MVIFDIAKKNIFFFIKRHQNFKIYEHFFLVYKKKFLYLSRFLKK